VALVAVVALSDRTSKKLELLGGRDGGRDGGRVDGRLDGLADGRLDGRVDGAGTTITGVAVVLGAGLMVGSTGTSCAVVTTTEDDTTMKNHPIHLIKGRKRGEVIILFNLFFLLDE
jgi:hypothetical protein